jgi:hypothetical protein
MLSFTAQQFVELSVNVNCAYLEGQMQDIRLPQEEFEINGNRSCAQDRAPQDSSRSSSKHHSPEQRRVK